MPESQNTEYKQTWRDEYLKWVSGFANAEGGVLEVTDNLSFDHFVNRFTFA